MLRNATRRLAPKSSIDSHTSMGGYQPSSIMADAARAFAPSIPAINAPNLSTSNLNAATAASRRTGYAIHELVDTSATVSSPLSSIPASIPSSPSPEGSAAETLLQLSSSHNDQSQFTFTPPTANSSFLTNISHEYSSPPPSVPQHPRRRTKVTAKTVTAHEEHNKPPDSEVEVQELLKYFRKSNGEQRKQILDFSKKIAEGKPQVSHPTAHLS